MNDNTIARAGLDLGVNIGGLHAGESQGRVIVESGVGSGVRSGVVGRVEARAMNAGVESDRRESARRALQHGFDDDDLELQPFRTLTPDQAEAVRKANPPVSPWRVVRAQAVAGMACVVAAAVLSRDAGSAWSALYGAVAAVLPSALLARGMTRGTQGAVAAAAGFLFWEMLKIGVAIAMLVIAAKVVPQLSWPVLLATMVVCIKVNWLALSWRGR